MGEENSLGLGNILGEQEIDTLFLDPNDEGNGAVESPKGAGAKESGEPNGEPEGENHESAEAVDPEDLFDGGEPESVGGEKDKGSKGGEGVSADSGEGASPSKNFYSSIANALAEDGIFPNLTDENVKAVNDAESFSDMIEAEVEARLDDRQKRISRALDDGVEAPDIKKYEDTLGYIASVTDDMLSAESEAGEKLRKDFIFQDFINKGYTPQKAKKLTERTVDAGTDIEDAREALQSNREYFQGKYDALLKQASANAEAAREERDRQAKDLKDSLMNGKGLLGDIDVTPDVRKKAFEALSKPVYRDSETGQYYTALQKYEKDHRADFMKYTGLIFAMTNGFKDFDNFAKGKARKEIRKGMRELERTLNNTSRTPDGSLDLSAKYDPNSYLGKGFKLDF